LGESRMKSGPSVGDRPAVVIGGERNGLGVCRSLAKGDVPTYVLDRRRRNAAMWSRYATPVKTSALHGAKLLGSLRSLAVSERDTAKAHLRGVMSDEDLPLP